MFFLISTFCLIASLVANHVVNGLGCWGLQRGGPTSALIYELQILVTVSGAIWLWVKIVRRQLPAKLFRLTLIGVSAIASMVMFRSIGWAAFTSVHYQGPENLLAVVPVFMTSLLIGTYGLPKPNPIGKKDASDKAAARVAHNANPKDVDADKPYRSPRGP